MKRILKEPLVHFLFLGALLFAGYGVLNNEGASEPRRIVVSQGQLASMRDAFTRTWQRPPTQQEWEGLIRDRVREEVYCREALAMGLDKDDTVIRRRLRQKMEFVSEDIAASTEPTDDELSAYLNAHPESFRVARRFTFKQVYLDPEKHGDTLASDTAQLLEQLNRASMKTDVSALGDALMLDHDFDALPNSEVEKLFGGEFAAKLPDLATGRWHGPIESGYGVHLVCVSERTEDRLPALAEVRDAVSREWANARRMEANEKLYEAMLKSYVVTIEQPPPAADEQKLSVAK